MTAFVAGQKLTAAQLNAAFAQYVPLGTVSSLSQTLLAGTTPAAWLFGLGLPDGVPGGPNGLATLDGGGFLPLSQLPAALQGAMSYQSTWNATTNVPHLTSSTGTKGYLYKCATAGTTTLDGISQWNVGDMAVFNGSTWDKWDGISSEVLSVAGRVGAVTLTAADISGVMPVANGGTGLSSLFNEAVLLGNGSSPLDAIAMDIATILVGQGIGTKPTAPIPSGDLIMSATGVFTVTKINGNPLGTSPNNILQLDGSGRLPAVDGSQLTNLPAGSGTRTINAQTGTAYTLVLADNGKLLTMTNAAANVVTVPPNSSVALPVGAQIDLGSLGAGQTSIAAGAGVTINSEGGKLKLSTQFSAGTLVQTAANVWLLAGSLAA